MSTPKPCAFSPCRRYRYVLWREWDDQFWGLCDDRPNTSKYLMVIGLNPSTADDTQDDPTIRRCKDFAKRWGFGALCMTNLFAFRATQPKVMKSEAEPVGADNDHWLLDCARGAGMILAAWGRHGSHRGRAAEVYAMLANENLTLHALRVNADGSGEHPLYIPADTVPQIYTLPLECCAQKPQLP